MVEKVITPADRLFARFGYTEEKLLACDVTVPLRERQDVAGWLVIHPDLKSGQFHFNVMFSEVAMKNEAARVQRAQREAVLEWVRVHVKDVHLFFSALVQDEFFDTYNKYYEKIRSIVVRLQGFCQRDQRAEAVMIGVIHDALEYYGRSIEAQKEQIRVIEEKAARMARKLSDPNPFNRTLPRNELRRLAYKPQKPEPCGLEPKVPARRPKKKKKKNKKGGKKKKGTEAGATPAVKTGRVEKKGHITVSVSSAGARKVQESGTSVHQRIGTKKTRRGADAASAGEAQAAPKPHLGKPDEEREKEHVKGEKLRELDVEVPEDLMVNPRRKKSKKRSSSVRPSEMDPKPYQFERKWPGGYESELYETDGELEMEMRAVEESMEP
jgi:hypothetical protein